MYTIKQKKCLLCLYHNKRYFHADLPDTSPNQNTYVYNHQELAMENQLVADQHEPGAQLIIWHREKRSIKDTLA